MNKPLLAKAITYCGVPCILVCDGNCRKAWGINGRPREQLSDDPDDYAFLADDELGEAPADPGSYEGGHGKPTDYDDPARQNKWCSRECERSELVECRRPISDFGGRVFNKHSRRSGVARGD